MRAEGLPVVAETDPKELGNVEVALPPWLALRPWPRMALSTVDETALPSGKVYVEHCAKDSCSRTGWGLLITISPLPIDVMMFHLSFHNSKHL